MKPRTDDEINALSHAELWDIYVGKQAPSEFVVNCEPTSTSWWKECRAYTTTSPLCEGLRPNACYSLTVALWLHIQGSVYADSGRA